MYSSEKTMACSDGRYVVRERDRAIIPADPANSDWQAYQVWLEAGNRLAEAQTTKPLPAPAVTIEVPD